MEVIGIPIPAIESDPISREEQRRNMAEFLGSIAQEMDIPPENPDYEWAPSDYVVPSGKGAKARERYKG